MVTSTGSSRLCMIIKNTLKLGAIVMRVKVPKKVLRIVWPIMKFFIVNFGKDIVMFVLDELRTIVTNKKKKEMEEALKKAEEAEQAAANAKSEEDKIKYYEFAKTYKEEAERKKQFIQEFMIDLDESVEHLTESVKERAESIEVNDVFGIEERDGSMKVLDTDGEEIKVKQSKRNIKVKKKRK